MKESKFLNLALLLLYLAVPTRALNITFRAFDASITLRKECSRKCESEFCSVPPLLRYGKYCGLLYSGCPGERPCDGLGACCMKHDDCVAIKNNNYLSSECNQSILLCMEKFKRSKSAANSFKGNKCKVNEVIDVISYVMEAALMAERVVFHKA